MQPRQPDDAVRGPTIRAFHDGRSEADYVTPREARDATLAPPVLLLPSTQGNMRAGRFPEAEANGVRHLRIPVRAQRTL